MDELKYLIAENLRKLDVLELKFDINSFRSFASYIELAEHLENCACLNDHILNLSILDSVGV